MSYASTQQESPVSNLVINESNWKMEFEELDRRFQGMPTEAEAKEIAKQELAKHDGVVKKLDNDLAQARAVLTGPSAAFLSSLDKLDIQKTIESLEYQLQQANNTRERSIRINGGRIRDVKEWAPKRKRWLELRKRAQDIDSAKNIARGKGGQDIAVGLPKKW
jgi:hypothetical protein